MAMCHVDELRQRLRNMRDALVNGEDSEDTMNLASEITSEMRELAWENRHKIKDYSCDERTSEEQNITSLLDLLVLTEVI